MSRYFLGVLNPATTVSLSGLACAFFAVLAAFWGYEALAITLFILTPLFDFFDGMVARKTNRTDREFVFGSRLDPMLDMSNFSFAPVLMFFLLGYSSPWQVALLLVFLICGALRQGDPEGGVKDGYFTGLPIPYSVGLLSIGWVIARATGWIAIFDIMLLLTSFLLIFRFPFRKEGGAAYVLWPLAVALWISAIWGFNLLPTGSLA